MDLAFLDGYDIFLCLSSARSDLQMGSSGGILLRTDDIWSDGDVLSTIQSSGLFADNKQFVYVFGGILPLIPHAHACDPPLLLGPIAR